VSILEGRCGAPSRSSTPVPAIAATAAAGSRLTAQLRCARASRGRSTWRMLPASAAESRWGLSPQLTEVMLTNWPLGHARFAEVLFFESAYRTVVKSVKLPLLWSLGVRHENWNVSTCAAGCTGRQTHATMRYQHVSCSPDPTVCLFANKTGIDTCCPGYIMQHICCSGLHACS